MDQGLRNYLTNTLGFPIELRNAIQGQGLTSFQLLAKMEEDELTQLCRVIRRPGGTVGAGNAPNPGTSVPLVLEKRLKMLWYYKRHLQNVSRPFAPAQATIVRLNDAWRVKERHETEAEENVPNPPALTSVNAIRECLENLDFYFQTKRGSRGHPLAYVT